MSCRQSSFARFACTLALIVLAVSAGAAESLQQAMKDVETIRDLHYSHPVKTVEIPRDKLPSILRAQLDRSLPYSFDDYILLLTTLRLVPPGTEHAEDKMIDLMQQQILAFYDPVSHVYYSISGTPPGLPAGASVDQLADAVSVHELTHALQDQRFAIGGRDVATRDDADASLAFHSLIEGEASLTMLVKMLEPMHQTIQSITSNEMILNAVSSATKMMNSSGDTPRYFVESLAIPYTAGLRFVVDVYRQGGWDRMNKVYADPPRSMREILHPDEYLAGHHTENSYPLSPPLPVHHLMTVEHLGEWHWDFLLGAGAGRGWKGDRVTVSQDDFCNPTVLIETEWDSPDRARAFADVYAAFLRKENIDAQVRVGRAHVFIAYGTDDALMDRFIEGAPQ